MRSKKNQDRPTTHWPSGRTKAAYHHDGASGSGHSAHAYHRAQSMDATPSQSNPFAPTITAEEEPHERAGGTMLVVIPYSPDHPSGFSDLMPLHAPYPTIHYPKMAPNPCQG